MDCSGILLLLIFFTDVSLAARLQALLAGDVMIGGLVPLHEDVQRNASFAPNVPQCVRLQERGVVRALAMIHAVQTLNAAPLLTNANLTLGLWIQDSCSDVSTALRATERFTQEEMPCATATTTNTTSSATAAATANTTASANTAAKATANMTTTHSERTRPIAALIGATQSEMSIAIARQLTLKMIPQISYSSTASILSDKSRFPAFLRTIPNDQHQTGAMVRLLALFGWSWVGIVTMDGDYGRSALDNFLSQTAESRICVAFRSILPGSTSNQNINNAIRQAALTIYNNPKVQVIVSFTKPTLMKLLFSELRRQALAVGDSTNTIKRVWIASDSWSSMPLQNPEEIGHVIGFHFKTGNTENFRRFLSRVEEVAAKRDGTGSGAELSRFYRSLAQEQGGAVGRGLRPELHSDAVFSVEMAISAVAHAAVRVCQEHNCKNPGALPPWQLLRALWTEEFEMDRQWYRFDQRGDINLGYDVSLWMEHGGPYIQETVAQYHPHNQSFTSNYPRANHPLQLLRSVVSRCSNSCVPGQFKKSAEGQHTCCYECINCTENYYSNHTDMDQCLSCDAELEWAPGGSAACLPKQEVFFCWTDAFAIVLLVFAALGVVLALLLSALFVRRRHTPVVRAAGGPLSQVILYSVVASFISAALFVGQPSSLRCKARQVLYGLSFTVCVSSVLAKTLQILLAFRFDPALQDTLRRLCKPYIVVSACVALQVVTCTCWLVLKSPSESVTNQATTLLRCCHEGSYVAFGAMLGYIALLAFVCFVCAFKCRKLPQQYNEARFITFSMLLYLLSWLLFIPIYVSTTGVYLPAVEMVVILICNYGILCCHFLPKAYVILLRSQKNTRSAFQKTLFEYTSRSTDSDSASESGVRSEYTSRSTDSQSVSESGVSSDYTSRSTDTEGESQTGVRSESPNTGSMSMSQSGLSLESTSSISLSVSQSGLSLDSSGAMTCAHVEPATVLELALSSSGLGRSSRLRRSLRRSSSV